MGKLVITTNKFPINTSDGVISGIGNLDITNTTGRSGLVSLRADIPCPNATTSFKIQMSFTTYSAWKQGDLLIGDYDKSDDSNDFRVFFVNSYVYYDFNSNRISTSSSSYLGKVNNWEIGNFYIKNLDTNTNILSGTTQSSNITTHLSRLSIWGWSDACIIHWLKVWQDGTNLTWDIIPYRDSQGFGLYDQVSQTMIYRVSNNNQAQSTQTVTQVQNIAWLDTMINKAYMGSNLIFEKTSLQYKLYIVNSQNPLQGTGGNIVAFLPYIKNVDSASPIRFEIDFIGFTFTGGTIIRQTSSTTQGSKGSEMYQRFFATSTSAYYIDSNYSRVNGDGPNCYNSPQHWSLCLGYFSLGSKLDLGWNNGNAKAVLWNHDTNRSILYSNTLSYNSYGSYSWHTWGYSDEIYGYNYIKVYHGGDNGWTLIRNWQAMENGNGTVYFHDTVKGTDVSLSGMYKYEYYAE